MNNMIINKYCLNDVCVTNVTNRQMLPYCKVAHITKIENKYEADCFFPNLDEDSNWKITADSDEQTYFNITYYFLKYERI